jgi:integrase
VCRVSLNGWVTRWNDELAAEPEMPGVWRRHGGGFRIRGRAIDPKTGRLREVCRALPDCRRARDAAAMLVAELERIRRGGDEPVDTFPRFGAWAVTVFDRKVTNGNIGSAAGRAKWESIIRLHLLPAFGDVLINRLSRDDVERWKARAIAEGAAPGTINTILGVLRQVTSEASREFDIRDVASDVDNANMRGHRTYTYEQPNSVRPADVPRFLAEIRCSFPDHYAFAFLGFTTGLRPSSLRPLRARGPNADVKWDDGKLLVRRSHTHRSEVMEATKTGIDQVIDLDPEQVSVLRWHVERLATENERRAKRSPHVADAQRASELLFPAAPTRWSAGGGFQSRSALDKAFRAVALKLELGYKVSPRAMRRTFQDLAREAKVHDIVTRAISGHRTEAMQQRYSTVAGAEVREGPGRGHRHRDRPPPNRVGAGGDGGGDAAAGQWKPLGRRVGNLSVGLAILRAGDGIRTRDVNLGKASRGQASRCVPYVDAARAGVSGQPGGDEVVMRPAASEY